MTMPLLSIGKATLTSDTSNTARASDLPESFSLTFDAAFTKMGIAVSIALPGRKTLMSPSVVSISKRTTLPLRATDRVLNAVALYSFIIRPSSFGFQHRWDGVVQIRCENRHRIVINSDPELCPTRTP